MTSTTKWRKCELRKSIGEFLNDYFSDQKLKNIKASVDTLVVYALSEQNQEILSKVEGVLEQGHGGGNWRRLILTKLTKKG